MTRKDFQRLAGVRLREAQALLDAELSDGSYYLAGYVVECALKACIAKRTKRHDFPAKDTVLASYSHDLTTLLVPAGIQGEHRKALSEPDFARKWEIVREWRVESRYESHSLEDATDLLTAITDRKSGLLRWIRQYW